MKRTKTSCKGEWDRSTLTRRRQACERVSKLMGSAIHDLSPPHRIDVLRFADGSQDYLSWKLD